MFSLDCSRCPARPGQCEGCIVSVLLAENPLLDQLSEESCGYVLEPAVRSAIEVLMDVGMVSTVQIMATNTAA